MKPKVFITGISGFIGSHLARHLAREGYQVSGISRKKRDIEGVETFKADVLDIRKMLILSQDKDVIIHLAARTTHREIAEDPFATLNLNLTGTYNMLSAFVKSRANHFIYPSSGKVYGNPQYLPYDESHPLNPETILGKSKKIAEDLIDFFALNSKKTFTILRIFNIYGPGQRKGFLVPTILSQIGKKTPTLGDIYAKRDYLYIEDLLEGFLTVIKARLKGLNVFNLARGRCHSAQQMVEIVGKILNKDFEIEIDRSRFRKGEFEEERANISKMKSLDWEAKISLEEGLKKTISSLSGGK